MRPLLKQIEERLPDGAGADFVEREPRAAPSRSEQPICLSWLRIRVSYCFLPLPDPLDQLLAAQIVPRLAFFFAKPPLDDGLRGDARVIGAGHPEGVEALHPLHADLDVLQRVVQGVAQVQRAGHIRRRNDNAERALGRIGLAFLRRLGVEEAARFPLAVDAGLGFGEVEAIGDGFGGEGRHVKDF